MRTAAPWAFALLTGCTCARAPVEEIEAAPPEAEAEVALPKGLGRIEERAPATQAVRFVVPLADASPDAAALRALVVAAAEGIASLPATGPVDDAGHPHRARRPLDAPEPWKCREATLWPTGAGATIVWQRWGEGACGASPERWHLERLRVTPSRTESRPVDGDLHWSGLVETRTWKEGDWARAYEASSVWEDEGEPPAFPHDGVWVSERLGAQVKDPPAVARSERWGLVRLDVAGERVTVVLERWTCADGRPVGATVGFDTVRRSQSHKKTDPRDALVAPKVQQLADAVRAALGDAVGTRPAGPVEALTCRP